MVKASVIDFDVVCRGALDWRVSISGQDESLSFPNRDACAAAARVRARLHNQHYGVTTRVRIPHSDGSFKATICYPSPEEFWSYQDLVDR